MADGSGRQYRVGDYLQRVLAGVIRDQLRDPRIRDAGLLTVNEVRVTRDLGYADVFVSVLSMGAAEASGVGNLSRKEQQDLIAGLESASGFLRSQVAREAPMRMMPKLRFQYDRAIEDGRRMDTLIKRARASDGDDSEGEPEVPER